MTEHKQQHAQDKPLPLPDYDQLPAASLEHRIRPLDRDGVEHLLEHERGHAARTPVLELLEARLRQLDAGSEPSSGDPTDTADTPGHTRKGSPASPDSAAPPSAPLRHGAHDVSPHDA
ncbi:hypothetical protein [Streptomyces sp. ODS28]|uniref:hypothetical protein n=1 Tax=Streptomyces sp. ODS28 TaxID=3136688 RepID=UPI0031E4FB46